VFDGLGLLELGDDPGFAAVGGDAVADEANVFRGADEGDGDGVNTVLEGEFEVLRIFFSERGNADGNAGEIDALVFAEQAAVDDFADYIVAVDLVNAEFEQAVGEQDAGALFNVFSEGLECGADQVAVPGTSRGVMVRRLPALSSTGT
jgi:hypothetical protein